MDFNFYFKIYWIIGFTGIVSIVIYLITLFFKLPMKYQNSNMLFEVISRDINLIDNSSERESLSRIKRVLIIGMILFLVFSFGLVIVALNVEWLLK